MIVWQRLIMVEVKNMTKFSTSLFATMESQLAQLILSQFYPSFFCESQVIKIQFNSVNYSIQKWIAMLYDFESESNSFGWFKSNANALPIFLSTWFFPSFFSSGLYHSILANKVNIFVIWTKKSCKTYSGTDR